MARFNRTGKGGSLLDNGVAALAALSGGFLAYAMPDGLFSRIVVASRLPSFLAAAQPPLGMKARLVVVAVAVLVVYAFIWSVMRALDGRGRKPAPTATAEPEAEAPRLRRADAHPDAPSRRPIFAGRDLGEPEHEQAPLELDAAAAFAPEPEADVTPEPEVYVAPEPEAYVAPEPEPEPLPAFLVPQQPEPEAAEAPEPVAFAEEPAPIIHEPAAFEEPIVFAEDEADEDEDGDEGEATEAGGSEDDQSLARLMHRFESGLTRKQQANAATPRLADAEPATEPAPEPVVQERVGHRLRSAISDLNKIAAPGR
ncbi:MAG: hypothetical protein QOH81_3431 [Sphingomonadales bacterium]|jgi:hypothetical protein|nr:hypothetical protein [Sphingomonadales bacterium]